MSDKKTIGGKGRLGISFSLNNHNESEINLNFPLDESKIYRLQIYFGKAIRDNNNDLEKMKQAAWAAWYHMASTGDHSTHDFCNPDHCQLYLDFDYKHEGHSLPPAVCAAIKPAYDELCRDDSLRQVLQGGITNANESFHRIIWPMCSKNKFHTRKRVANATHLAVIIYNDGFIGLIPIYKSFGITLIAATLGTLKKSIVNASQMVDRSILFFVLNNVEGIGLNDFEMMLNSRNKININTVLESLTRELQLTIVTISVPFLL